MKRFLIPIIGVLVLLTMFLTAIPAMAVDGSGTCTVLPNTVVASSTGNTLTFTYTATETMDGGAITIAAPAGWSAPQGTGGTAGYTTCSSTLGTTGKVLSNLDATTGWVAADATDITLSADSGTKMEGTASLKAAVKDSATVGYGAPDRWYYLCSPTQNWSSYTKVGFWIRSSIALFAGDFVFVIREDVTLPPSDSISIPALAANTWTHVTLTFPGAGSTRDFVQGYGLDMGVDRGACDIYLDEILIGPDNAGAISFASQVATVRILALANTQTITVTYGSGGGASGATAQPTAGTATFTTQSKRAADGTLTNITTSPTVTVTAPPNPAPTTTSISPTSKTVGDVGFPMTVNGTNFVATSVVRFNGSDRTTAYVSATELTATIPAINLLAAGTFNITVFNPAPGGGTSLAQTFTVNKATPTITWNNPADIVYGTALSSTQLNATASVAGGFVYTPPATTVLNAGAGQPLHVAFTPTDTANYNNASKDVTINVSKANTTTTVISSISPSTYGQSVTFTATVSGTGGPPTGTVQFKDGGGNMGSPVALIGGIATYSTSALTAGSHTITAEYGGDSNFNGSTGTLPTQTVNKATPTITWNNPANIVYGTALSSTQLNATASVVGSFIYTPPATTVLNAGLAQTLHVAFTPTDTANYNNASKDVTINVSKASQTITFGVLAGKTYGDPPFDVSATASSGLPVSFFISSGPATILGNTVTITGAGTVTVRASQAGNANYNLAADVYQTFNVAKAPTTTTVISSVNPSNSGQLVTFTATVSSSAATGWVQFKDGVTNLDGQQLLNGSGVAIYSTTGLSIGSHTITAVYTGDNNYNGSTGTLSGGQIVYGCGSQHDQTPETRSQAAVSPYDDEQWQDDNWWNPLYGVYAGLTDNNYTYIPQRTLQGPSGYVYNDTFNNGDYSYVLYVTNYGFTIPDGVTITGIEVEYERHSENGTVIDALVQLVKNGTTLVGDNRSAGASWASAGSLPDPDENVIFGSPTDLWGESWTHDDIENPGFGVAIVARAGSDAARAFIDDMDITVYYCTCPTCPTCQHCVNGSCVDDLSQDPVAAFSATPISGCAPLTVTFTNSSTNATIWSWDFNNDGTPDSTLQSPAPYTYNAYGTYTVSLTVTNACGSDTETKNNYITVYGTPTAVISITPDATCGLTISYAGTGSVDPNPPPNLTYSWDFQNDGTPDSTSATGTYTYSQCGRYTVSLTVTDPNAPTPCNTNTATQVINPSDTTDPVITVPADLTLECGDSGNGTAYNNWLASASATDNCDISVNITNNGPAFSALESECSSGTGVTVEWTATDDCGNTDSGTAVVKILDTTDPVITCPEDVTIECDEPTDPSNTGQATATDNCDPSPIVTYSDSTSGACPTVITRTWTATDDCGNSSQCVQTITVQDTTDPVITVPADITIRSGESTDPSNTGQATATDNCDPSPAVTYSDITSGTAITRTWTATDACDNSTSEVQTITIETPPPPRTGGGAGPETYYLIVDMLGKRTQVEMNYLKNTTKEKCQAYDAEQEYLLAFPKGTQVLCGDCESSGCYPKIIVMSPSDESITPPEGMAIVGPIFDFTGYKDLRRQIPCHVVTSFDPVASVLLNYDPELVPTGGFDPVIGFYSHEQGQWILLPPDTGVVAAVGVATGLTDYFASPFAVLVSVPPTAPATPEPTPPTPEPAHFVASGLNISPAEVKAGDNVTISLNVANDGETAGSYLVELKINGNVIDSKTVTLNSGQSEAVSFAVSSAEAGTYEASASGLSGSFTVEAASNWWIYLIIAAVVILGGVLVFLIRKRV